MTTWYLIDNLDSKLSKRNAVQDMHNTDSTQENHATGMYILEKVRLPPRQLELVVIQIRNTYVRAYHMYVPDLWQIYYEHLYLVDHEPGTVICHDM